MEAKCREKFSGIIRMMLKISISAAVILWLCCKNAPALKSGFTSFNYLLLIPALLISLFEASASSLRWKELANAIDIKLSRFKAFSLTMQGKFFSLVIPGGAIGGDVIKMAALSSGMQKGCRTEGIFSIIMDRIVGMIALFVLAIILLIARWNLFYSLNIPGVTDSMAGLMLWWIFMCACAAGLLAGTAVFCHRQIVKLPGINSVIQWLDRKSSGKIVRMENAADIYKQKYALVTSWTLLSIFTIHLPPVISMGFLLAGAGESVNWMTVTTAVIIGNIAGLIPLFPGGIGARDAVTIALLTAGGCPMEAATAAQLLATLLLILFNLTGSIFFIFDRKPAEVEK